MGGLPFEIARRRTGFIRVPGASGDFVARAGIVLLTLTSLWAWNRDSSFDMWALYFFGAYGLGMLAWWAVHEPKAVLRFGWNALILTVLVVALLLEWRDRIALAGITALALVWGSALSWPACMQRCSLAPLQRLGQMSYSIFIVHFGVSLLVNAVVHLLWPTWLVFFLPCCYL